MRVMTVLMMMQTVLLNGEIIGFHQVCRCGGRMVVLIWSSGHEQSCRRPAWILGMRAGARLVQRCCVDACEWTGIPQPCQIWGRSLSNSSTYLAVLLNIGSNTHNITFDFSQIGWADSVEVWCRLCCWGD